MKQQKIRHGGFGLIAILASAGALAYGCQTDQLPLYAAVVSPTLLIALFIYIKEQKNENNNE